MREEVAGYPALYLRIKAMCIDSVVLVLLFFLLVFLVSTFNIANTAVRAVVMFGPVVLLEPVMIWLTGGSIGHHLSRIKVIDKVSGGNLFILKAITRVLVKYLLGFYSVVTMFLTQRRQSLHDVVSGSVVVFKNEGEAPERHKLQALEERKNIPSLLRRILVTALYLVLMLILFSAIFIFTRSTACLDSAGACSSTEKITEMIASIIWLLASLVVLVAGLRGYLPGARATESFNDS